MQHIQAVFEKTFICENPDSHDFVQVFHSTFIILIELILNNLEFVILVFVNSANLGVGFFTFWRDEYNMRLAEDVNLIDLA